MSKTPDLQSMMDLLKLDRQDVLGGADADQDDVIAWATACMMEAVLCLKTIGGPELAKSIVDMHASRCR